MIQTIWILEPCGPVCCEFVRETKHFAFIAHVDGGEIKIAKRNTFTTKAEAVAVFARMKGGKCLAA